MAMPRNVAPSGLPTWRSRIVPGGAGWGRSPSRSVIVVLSRNSCVMAMPMEAKAREVRSQARKVRSVGEKMVLVSWGQFAGGFVLTFLYMSPGSKGSNIKKGGGKKRKRGRGERERERGRGKGLTQGKMIAGDAALVIQFDAAVLLHHVAPPLRALVRLVVADLGTGLAGGVAPPSRVPGGESAQAAARLADLGAGMVVGGGAVVLTAAPLAVDDGGDLVRRAFGMTVLVVEWRSRHEGFGAREGGLLAGKGDLKLDAAPRSLHGGEGDRGEGGGEWWWWWWCGGEGGLSRGKRCRSGAF